MYFSGAAAGGADRPTQAATTIIESKVRLVRDCKALVEKISNQTALIFSLFTTHNQSSSSSSSSSAGSFASANNEVTAPPPASRSHSARLALSLLRTNNQDGISAADEEMQVVPPKGGGAKEEPTIEMATGGRRGRSTPREEGRGEAARAIGGAAETASTKAHGKMEACLQWLERPSCIGKFYLVMWCLAGVIVALVIYQVVHDMPILPSWLTGKDDEDA